jgi:tetratricopeptide (TPR) repeat protein
MPLPTPFRAQGFAIFLLVALAFPAPGQVATNRAFAARAEKEFFRAQKEFTAHPGDAIVAWQFGRASFDHAEFATNETQRAALAQTGIAACRQSLAHAPKSAPAHYYLAMNFGQLAEAEAPSIAAYKLVKEIEHEFKAATELDEKFDFAGPPRCLGLLYRDAPGWPISIGSKHKAREFLDRAVVLAPDYPENQLNLAESHVRWHQPAEAEKALKKLDALWPAAQTNLVGDVWAKSWDDWAVRRAAVKVEFQKIFKRAPDNGKFSFVQ